MRWHVEFYRRVYRSVCLQYVWEVPNTYEPVNEISNNVVCATIRAVWSEPLLDAWVFYDCSATDWTPFGVYKLTRRLQMLVRVYTCQNDKLLEISCRCSMVHYLFAVFRAKCAPKDENQSLSKIKKAILPPSTPVLHQKKSVTKFGSIYVEECL